ncbi:ferredoxin-type protein NapF [Vibrio vulnificus]|uniref:Ferredoxin-type protein NapF n=1 Tax=Vibrio vulnificus TaxID=672 RepID=A0AAW4H9R7_VIBVL|nr:ferredoxin-type protein NapF [Vibrio vulnificus]EGQ7930922.1 ferredoxin-type protein NapF [Vibrio vulnificus]EGQ7994655.1 ferredoxin-type protein NapF [Vibrio vulnificus]EGQ8022036.1 ferredoxin-type protein NapF [Vibrio vulnificus]EGQ8077117.1 ferredoxin-type protein NapF [Vibrio vulnificus]EGQ8086467.1 ferredoxin-type protein NapF [Vibrio vulnificus]
MVDLSRRRLFSRKKVDDGLIRLPWLADRMQFTDQCTRCGKCVEQCETQIIVKGDGGFPTVDFSIDECTFCYRCAEICPESLFLAKDAQPWQARAIINESCLSYHNVECRSCGEMCEPMAIQFKLEIGKVAQPQINLDECSGCGACVSVCPSSSINVSINE